MSYELRNKSWEEPQFGAQKTLAKVLAPPQELRDLGQITPPLEASPRLGNGRVVDVEITHTCSEEVTQQTQMCETDCSTMHTW